MKTLPDYLTTWLPDRGCFEEKGRNKKEILLTCKSRRQTSFVLFSLDVFPSVFSFTFPFSFLIVADSFSILPSYDSSSWWWRRKVSLPFSSFFSFPLPGSVLPVSSSLHLFIPQVVREKLGIARGSHFWFLTTTLSSFYSTPFFSLSLSVLWEICNPCSVFPLLFSCSSFSLFPPSHHHLEASWSILSCID